MTLRSFHGAEGAAHVTLTSTSHSEAAIRSPSTQLRIRPISSDLFFCSLLSTFRFICFSSHLICLYLFLSRSLGLSLWFSFLFRFILHFWRQQCLSHSYIAGVLSFSSCLLSFTCCTLTIPHSPCDYTAPGLNSIIPS